MRLMGVWSNVVVKILAALLALTIGLNRSEPQAKSELWLAPNVERLAVKAKAPYVRAGDGTMLAVTGSDVLGSKDGVAWSKVGSWPIGSMVPMHDKALLTTKKGTVVSVFTDTSTRVFSWDKKNNRPSPGNRMEVFAVRSEDDGKSWSAPVPVFTTGYAPQARSMIQLEDGRIVVSLQNLDTSLARQVVFMMVSDDDGKTWKRGGTIDIGGRGITDGILEASIVETTPNHIFLVGRTSRDQLYFAQSKDRGMSFTDVKASGISASSSPASIIKLESGVLFMAYNPEQAESGAAPRRVSGDNSERAASWFRDELAVTFSKDNGKSWSKPQVIARQAGAQIAYVRLFEPKPGEIWIASLITDVRMKLKESDFVK
ncbi:MAG: exo-alpha-sialidase [Fimbriimonadaceae bacterium]|nr:exo-alpha-sialidase [Fimbriimonadaceae bacterium]QYK59266.1 MAG: exo-alpha-sialidase [Fimbriimonadaceae bacterium]